MNRIGVMAGFMSIWLLGCGAGGAEDWLLYLDLRGERIEGRLLNRDGSRVRLMGRDGRLWRFDAAAASNFGVSESPFQSHTLAEMRNQLRREFGRDYEITGTGYFLVVHPRGASEAWSSRFEELYRNFVHYFSVRGQRPRTPQFPLVAVIYRNQGEFLRSAAAQGVKASDGLVGYYSPESNRIEMFEQPMDPGRSSNWHSTAKTIIHEAAHQSAFNTGIHSRFAEQPRWLVEGLGTMFEAPGVNDSRKYSRLEDRINFAQLAAFRRNMEKHRLSEDLPALLATDQMFRTDPQRAYAESWALSFYLVETQPRKFFALLSRTAEREMFSQYSAEARLTDFVDVIGSDFRMLEVRMREYFQKLPH